MPVNKKKLCIHIYCKVSGTKTNFPSVQTITFHFYLLNVEPSKTFTHHLAELAFLYCKFAAKRRHHLQWSVIKFHELNYGEAFPMNFSNILNCQVKKLYHYSQGLNSMEYLINKLIKFLNMFIVLPNLARRDNSRALHTSQSV